MRAMLSKPQKSASIKGDPIVGLAAVTTSLMAVCLGAAFAKSLFPLIGPNGVTALRISLTAIILLCAFRPWRRSAPTMFQPAVFSYGAALGVMNLSVYHAFERLPIGIVTGIEVLGPLAVVLWSSRTGRDFVWLGVAALGLLLLLPLTPDARLDPVGIVFALGGAFCWALYIVSGTRLAGFSGGDAVAWGMLVASFVTLPMGAWSLGAIAANPWVLGVGLLVALLSSALPYSLEMIGMRTLPTHTFGILLSASPAVSALTGLLILGEHLAPLQWLAIGFLSLASAGSAFSAARMS